MKIIYGSFGHEGNTFSSEIGSFERFAPSGWGVGDEVYERNAGGHNFVTGMIKAANDYGVELLPTISIVSAAPKLTAECVEKVLGTMLDYVRKYAGEADACCFNLHGAGNAEGIDDLETYVLREIRKIVGNNMPITVCSDLHGNISQDMLDLIQAEFGIKEYPHVDEVASGYKCMESAIKLAKGETKLECAMERLNMLISAPFGNTFNEPMKWFKDLINEYEKKYKLRDVTLFHGFPYADVPCSGASIVVVSDENSLIGATEAAKIIKDHVWSERHRIDLVYPQPAEAIDLAMAERKKYDKGYVVINETSDNPGGGCPGDGTYLCRALIEKNIPRSIFGFMYDREIALKANELGVGAHLSGFLGAKTDNQHGEPIFIEDAEVLALGGGTLKYTSPVTFGLPVSYGKTALLRVGNVHIVVSEIMPEQTFDDSPFLTLGIHLEDGNYDLVCLKSSNHFRAFFADKSVAIVTTDPPGIHTGNLKQLTFTKIPRPIWPLDEL